MKEEEVLVIIKGTDRTKDIKSYKETEDSLLIKFSNNEKPYSYKKANARVIKKTKEIKIGSSQIYYKGQCLFHPKKAIIFDDLIKVFYQDNSSNLFNRKDIVFSENKNVSDVASVMDYFKEISKYVKDSDENKKSKKEDSKQTFLEREYQKINYVNASSVLSFYLNKILPPSTTSCNQLIFPFSFNTSQKQAIENVSKKDISVIEGPPGTGKTQTILNLIANLAIMQDKKVAVVSNNNDAVKNVRDKLIQYGYGFLAANLGKGDNQKEFFQDLIQPNVTSFHSKEEEETLYRKLDFLNQKLDYLLDQNRKRAELEQQIRDYKLEEQHFKHYYEEEDKEAIKRLSFYKENEDKILKFLFDSQFLHDNNLIYRMIYKIKFFFCYHMNPFKDLNQRLMSYILQVQKDYYRIKIDKLEKEYRNITEYLTKHSFDSLQKEHKEISSKIFQKKLYEKYYGKKNDFCLDDYKQHMDEFMKSFPVILSTTYSLRNSIPKDFLFDYVIIDESSQVDLLAGCLALSCTKGAIIVGDTKQLPQIVDWKIKEKIGNKEVDDCYDYFQNSLLSAILKTYKDEIPQKTLEEHYRCHPSIIDFCNKRYYHNQLISYQNEEHEKIEKPLILYYTAKGNHMRKITNGLINGTYNQRELDVIKEEVLKNSNITGYKKKDIGITTPYRLQADKMTSSLIEHPDIESDTIHKYQGREKKVMILSTVLDSSFLGKKGIFFVDDPCMINVAVSRAINQFIIVTDHELFHTEGKEIKALLNYIKYQTLDKEIIESNLVSVFDLLYKEYSKELEVLSKKLLTRSRYKSENIMDTILNMELEQDKYKDYSYSREVLLKNMIKDTSYLTEKEARYIENRASIDFVIHDKMNNKPFLFIEVDGTASHENNKKQLEKDELKDSIASKSKIPLLRFRTNDLHYEDKIRKKVEETILKHYLD